MDKSTEKLIRICAGQLFNVAAELLWRADELTVTKSKAKLEAFKPPRITLRSRVKWN
jgi:hypothetical protein